MFRIIIDLTIEFTQGLDALDFCRRAGVPESIQVARSSASAACEVDEGFARLWFGRTSLSQRADVTIDMLVPGELCLRNGAIDLVDTLSPERIKDLFVASRYRDLKPNENETE